MAIKMNLGLKQTQGLMMTPQLQQAIKLLTLTHLEMTNVIANEMVENPMLEEMGGESTSKEVEAREKQSQEKTADDFQKPDIVEGGREDFDWDKYIESYNSNSSSPPSMTGPSGSDETPNYENMVSRGDTLVEHLEWQLRMESYSEDEMKFAMEVIHNLDDDGYLRFNFDELISKFDLEREDAYETLWMIQSLDPVGCAAFNLKDCLMIQAKALPDRSVLVETIIEKYLDELQSNDYTKIAKELSLEREKVKDAELVILSFNPKPGKIIGADDTHYIVPDI
jgi:RNA polymerase sigma-54 factor